MNNDNIFMRLIDWLLGTGRLGGVVSLLLAGVCLTIIVVDVLLTGSFFVALLGVLGLFLLLGVLLLILGRPSSSKAVFLDESVPPPPDLIERLRNEHRPFYFCSNCWEVMTVVTCTTCKSSSNTVEVQSEDDVDIAIATIS